MFANLIQIPGLQDWWLNGHGNGLCTGFTTKLDYKISISYKNLFFMKSITPNILLNIFIEKNITNEMYKKQQKFINQLYLHYNI